jgi:hypothetical protein
MIQQTRTLIAVCEQSDVHDLQLHVSQWRSTNLWTLSLLLRLARSVCGTICSK